MVLAAAVLTGVFRAPEWSRPWRVAARNHPGLAGPAPGRHHGHPQHAVHVLHEQRRLLLRHPARAHRDGGHYGISAVEMARASITGQPFHMQSPLVPAILLLVTLAGGPGRPPQEGAVARGAGVAVDARRGRADRSHRHRLVCMLPVAGPPRPGPRHQVPVWTPAGGRQAGTDVSPRRLVRETNPTLAGEIHGCDQP